jgi:hypothetical protein
MYCSFSSQDPSVVLQVEALEDRCVPSTADYVTGLYAGILHRSPAPAEVAGWVDALNQGASPGEIALAFTTSLEHATNVIRADYRIFLDRQPGPAEVAGWLQQLQAGLGEKQVEAAFLASNEYFSRHAGSALPWLKGVYQDVLGRAPDPAGRNAWSQALQAGASRDAVALAIVDSPEADSRLVTAAYLDLLRRNPDPPGLATSVEALQQGLAPSELLAIIASSDEFIGLTANGQLDTPIAPPVADSVLVPVGPFYDPVFFDPFRGDPFFAGVAVGIGLGPGDGCGCDPGFDGSFDPGFDGGGFDGGVDGGHF